MNKVGPRTKAWISAWKVLKREFERQDVTRCEFDFIPHECDGTVTPAHSKKRRKMEGVDIFCVALACIPAHRILDEKMSHEEMEEAVLKAIHRRIA